MKLRLGNDPSLGGDALAPVAPNVVVSESSKAQSSRRQPNGNLTEKETGFRPEISEVLVEFMMQPIFTRPLTPQLHTAMVYSELFLQCCPCVAPTNATTNHKCILCFY